METHLAFVAYVIALISLAVSVYVAYLLSEVKDSLRKFKKPQQRPPTKVARKGHWN